MFLGTNSLSVLMCRKAVNRSINQSYRVEDASHAADLRADRCRPRSVQSKVDPCKVDRLVSRNPVVVSLRHAKREEKSDEMSRWIIIQTNGNEKYRTMHERASKYISKQASVNRALYASMLRYEIYAIRMRLW